MSAAPVISSTVIPDVLTTDEAWAYLRISRSKLYALKAAGELTGFGIGRCRRYQRSELDAYIDRQRERERQGCGQASGIGQPEAYKIGHGRGGATGRVA